MNRNYDDVLIVVICVLIYVQTNLPVMIAIKGVFLIVLDEINELGPRS